MAEAAERVVVVGHQPPTTIATAEAPAGAARRGLAGRAVPDQAVAAWACALALPAAAWVVACALGLQAVVVVVWAEEEEEEEGHGQ